MRVSKLCIASNACILLLGFSACTQSPALPPPQAARPLSVMAGPVQPSPPAPGTRSRHPDATGAACTAPPGSNLGTKPLKLKVQVDVEGRRFLLSTAQRVVITSAEPSDADTVVIREAFVPIADESTVAVEPVSMLYITQRLHGAFDSIEVTQSAPVRAGQGYEFTGTAVVDASTHLPGYISVYYDAPPNADRAVTVGLATRSQDESAPQPISHYVLQRFETRAIPIPGPCILILIAGGVRTGETLPISLLRPSTAAQAVSGEVPTVPQSPGAPMVSRYLRVDLTASEQAVVHFDTTLNAFQYGPQPN